MKKFFELTYILPKEIDVIRRLNYNPKKTILTEDIANKIQQELINSKDFIKPKGIVDEVIISIKEDKILFEDFEINSKKLSELLKKSKIATILAATIGEELTLEVEKRLKNENYTEAVILDAIGSEAVETFTNHIQSILEREKKLSGYKATMRYSPGYGDLSIDFNSYILERLDAKKINLTLYPESKILHPEKSITAIIGWEK
ncbi:MAG: hypothetical protein N2258_02545 [Brevinematales bacterium]|nr:hypothetical protein [Brevinematales bacterium]